MLSFLKETIGFDTITFGFCIFAWYIILLPILFYYLQNYYANINDPFIRPRNPRLSLLSNYFLMILLFIIAPIQWGEIIYFDSYYIYLREYLFFIRVIWEQLSMWFRLIRYWHLWYKYQYQKHCALSVYIKAININATKSNYFVQHKSTLGNLKFLFLIIFIIWSIQIIFCIFIILIFQHESSYFIITTIGFIFYLTQCIVFILLSITINKIRDSLYIRTEVFYESIAALFSCLVLFIILLFSNFEPFISYNMMQNKYFISLIMFIFPGFICYPLMIGITSCWVYSKMKYQWHRLNKLELDRYNDSNNISNLSSLHIQCPIPSHSMTLDNLQRNLSRNTMSICEESRNDGNLSPRNDNLSVTFTKLDFIDDKIDPRLVKTQSFKSKQSASTSQQIKSPFLLKKFLPNKLGFELFAEHLIKEYAIENLLFLIEVEKFKRNCRSKYPKQLSMEQRAIPKSLPPSVGLKAFHKKLKLQYTFLYHKYIDSAKAEFSVNIASRNRLICQQLYNEWYDIAHGLMDGYYDTDFDDDEHDEMSRSHLSPKVRTPRTPKLQKRFSNKYDNNNNNNNNTSKLKSSLKRVGSLSSNTSISTIKRRESFPNTTIIGFRGKTNTNIAIKNNDDDDDDDDDVDEEQKQLKSGIDKQCEIIQINTDITDIKEETDDVYIEEIDQSTTTTISILPPLNSISSKSSNNNIMNNININNNNNNIELSKSNKLSVVPYMKLAKKRLSKTITPTPSTLSCAANQYPPHLTINIDEHSFDTRSVDQLTIYEQCELTDNEETPAPPTFLTPQVTPQATPLPIPGDGLEVSQNNIIIQTETDKIDNKIDKTDKNNDKPSCKVTLQPVTISNNGLDPITPLTLSPPISRRASRELSALPDDDTADEMEDDDDNDNVNDKVQIKKKLKDMVEHKKNITLTDTETAKNLTVNKLLSIDSVVSQSATMEESILSKSITNTSSHTNISSSCSRTVTVGSESITNKIGHRYVKVSITERPSMASMSKSWSVDVPNTIKRSIHFAADSSCDLDGDINININETDTPIPDGIDTKTVSLDTGNKKTTRYSLKNRALQKRTSVSLLHLTNRVPRNLLNGRIEEMMFLMDEKQKNTSSAKEILNKYIDDLDDTQAMIDALDNCLKDVFANLRDSFGRFVFTDPYKRWSGDDE